MNLFCAYKKDKNTCTLFPMSHFQLNLTPSICTFWGKLRFFENHKYFRKKSKKSLFFVKISLKTPFSLYATKNERKNWKKSFPSFCPNFFVFSKTAQNPDLSRDKASRLKNNGIPDMKNALNSHKRIKTQLLRSRGRKKIHT